MSGDGICKTTFGKIKELMEDSFGELVDKYVTNGDKYIAKIQEALSIEDYYTLERSAHPLKSSSASLGFSDVSEKSTRIEALAKIEERSAAEQEELEKLVHELSDNFSAVKDFLKSQINS